MMKLKVTVNLKGLYLQIEGAAESIIFMNKLKYTSTYAFDINSN